MTGPHRTGPDLDALAALEEERRFLLRSLHDLEREHEAGDVDSDDYETLKDGYTARAADVLRQIDQGREALAPRRPRRWGLIAAVSAAVVLGAAGIGVVLAQAWGERGVNQEITGFSPGDDVRAVLASARAALGSGDLPRANQLFLQALEADRERGIDNPEALTYYGWTLALGTRNNPDQSTAAQQLDVALIALDTAIEMDAGYADPYCYIAIIESNFRDDPERALRYLGDCQDRNPPGDIADLIAAFEADIRAAVE